MNTQPFVCKAQFICINNLKAPQGKQSSIPVCLCVCVFFFIYLKHFQPWCFSDYYCSSGTDRSSFSVNFFSPQLPSPATSASFSTHHFLYILPGTLTRLFFTFIHIHSTYTTHTTFRIFSPFIYYIIIIIIIIISF